jgi:TonB-linked SusC/RagA family outer membrane protein
MYKKYTNKLGVQKLLCRKILLIMRLTTVILIASLMQVSANSLGQQITLSKKNILLESALKEIRRQSGFDIIFDARIIPKNQLINIDVKNAGIDQVMKTVLNGLPFYYSKHGNIVSINRKISDTKTSDPKSFSKAEITVKGKVVNENGEPLSGASIFVQGDPEIAVSTNIRGEFILTKVDEKSKIIVAFMGYNPMLLTPKPDLGVIRMEVIIKDLSEVEITFNTGYQQISKERSAGSFSKPDLKVMLDRSAGSPTLLNRLEGLVPGLSSGAGGNGGMVIRGTTTLNLNTEPLYVVDGIQVSREIFDNLNVQSVEDITVLKDATASSIWGAKAANGVIVVTTKKGNAGDKLRIDYDGYVGFNGRPDRYYIPRISNDEHIALARELFPEYSAANSWASLKNSNLPIPPHLQVLYDAKRNLITSAQANFKLDSLSKISNTDQINDLLIRDASILNQTLSISGGGKVHSFYGAAQHIGRVSNTPDEHDNSYQLLLNNQFSISKRIKINVNAEINNRLTKNGNVTIPDGIAENEYQLLKDANGNPLNANWAGTFIDSLRTNYQTRSRINLNYNPIAEQSRAYSTNNTLSARFQGGGTIDLFKGLRFTGTYGYNHASTTMRAIQDESNYTVRVLKTRFTVSPTLTSVPVYNLPQFGGTLETTNALARSWTIRNQLTYNRDFNKHQVTAMFAQEARSEQTVNSNGYFWGWDDAAQTFTQVDALRLQNTVAGVAGSVAGVNLLNLSPDTKELPIARQTSYVASAAYTFDRKYSLNGSWRIDESNLFGFDKSAQNKPVYSIGGKWSLGNEEFMKPISWLNRLDLRLTYGITGNAPRPGQAASFDIFAATVNINAVNGSGLSLQTPANSKLTWEITKNYNLGLDFSVLNNRLSGTVDAYMKNTSDLIGIVITSPLSGYASVTGNFGDLQNKGIDVGLNSVNVRSRNFAWGSSLILGYNKNKLTKLNISNVPTTGAGLVGTSFTQGRTQMVGQSLYSLYAYNYAGLNASGDPQIRLADGTLTAAPNTSLPVDILRMGVTQAPLSAGLGNNFQYKSFNLSVNMIFNAGHVIRDPRVNTVSGVIAGNNYQAGFLERWKVPNDETRTDIPRYVANTAINASRDLNYYNLGSTRILSADYLKIRDISLSYTLPRLVASKIRAQSITFRCNVNNLMLWTANDLNFDPEVNRTNQLQITNVRPAQGTVSFGAHISF